MGRTPLHWACLGQKLDVVSCLVNAGADVDYADEVVDCYDLHHIATTASIMPQLGRTFSSYVGYSKK